MTPIEIKCILFATFACAAPFPATQKHYPFGLLKQNVALEKDIRCKCRASQFWSLYPGSDIVRQLQILVTSFPPFSTFSSTVCQPAHSCGFLLFYFGYPLTTLFSFAFIAGFVFRLIVRRYFGAVLISVLPVLGQLCMNICKFNTNITFVRLLPSRGILLPSGGGYNSILGR